MYTVCNLLPKKNTIEILVSVQIHTNVKQLDGKISENIGTMEVGIYYLTEQLDIEFKSKENDVVMLGFARNTQFFH